MDGDGAIADLLLEAFGGFNRLVGQDGVDVDSIAKSLVLALRKVLSGSEVWVVQRVPPKEPGESGSWSVAAKYAHGRIAQPIDVDRYAQHPTWHVRQIPQPLPGTSADRRLAILVRSKTKRDHDRDRWLIDAIAYLAEHAFGRALDRQSERLAFAIMRDAALFPNASDDNLAYRILGFAKTISPQWLSAAFWRTTRTASGLEKIAEVNREARQVRREVAAGWHTIPYLHLATTDERALRHRLPSSVVVALADDETATALMRRTFPEFSRPLSTFPCRTLTGRQASFHVWVPHGLRQADGPTKEQVLSSLSLLLPLHELRQQELFVLASSERGMASINDELYPTELAVHLDARVPGPFQLIVCVRASAADEFSPERLCKLEALLQRAAPAFNMISLSRFHLRRIVHAMASLRSSNTAREFEEALTHSLDGTVGARAWLLVDPTTATVTHAHRSLSQMLGLPVDLRDWSRSDLERNTSIRDTSPDWLKRCRSLVQDEVQGDFRALRDRGAIGPATQLFSPLYDSVGFAALRLPCSGRQLWLVVFKGHQWRVRAMEEMSLRLCRDAIVEALDRIGSIEQAHAPKIRTGTEADLESQVHSYAGDVPGFAKHVLQKAHAALAFHGAFFAVVDDDGRVFQPVACEGPVDRTLEDAILPIHLGSFAGMCLLHRRGLLGQVTGDAIEVFALDGSSSLGQTPYLQWLPNAKTAIAVPLHWGNSAEPRAVIVFSWRADLTRASRASSLAAATGTCEFLASLAARWLERESASVFWQHWGALQPYLSQLRSVAAPELIPEPTRGGCDAAAHLPPLSADLRGLYSEAFRVALSNVLECLAQRLQLVSATVRLKRLRLPEGSATMELLAATGTWKTAALPFSPNENVNSYCQTASEQKESAEPAIISVTHVGSVELLTRTYPGLRYRPDRSDTRAEWTISLVAQLRDERVTLGTINLEARDFWPLWFSKPLLLQIGSLISTELHARCAHMERSVAGAAEYAIMLAGWTAHEVARTAVDIEGRVLTVGADGSVPAHHREGLSIAAAAARELADLHQSYLRRLASRLDVHGPVDLAEVACRSMSQIEHWADVRRLRVRPAAKATILDGVPASVYSHEALEQILISLLREQLESLDKLAANKPPFHLAAFLHRAADGRHTSLSICSDGPPIDTELCTQLFWQRVDSQRPAHGVAGMGLAMAGVMLRAVGAYPIAHSTSAMAPWHDIAPRFCGGWMELLFRPERTV